LGLKKGLTKPLFCAIIKTQRKRGKSKWLKRIRRRLTAECLRKREKNFSSISTSVSVVAEWKTKRVKALTIAKSSRRGSKND
jgi:hypothetical protein